MAYMNQEKKAKIAAALKLVVPKSWKYSLSVRDNRAIVMTIKSSPIDLLAGYSESIKRYGYVQNIQLHLDIHMADEARVILSKIIEALNIGNFDNSDSQVDYFEVGHYVDLNVDKWHKPFVVA